MDSDVVLYQQKDFERINAISVVLGTACNMSCRHCHQMPVKNSYFSRFCISNKVLQLLGNYIKYSSSVKLHNNSLNQIVFWGGEPLLYWDYIKDLVLLLEDKFNAVSGHNICFSITTNGKLLTEDIVSFINKHNMRVGFSYEAPFPWAIRDYVSDSVCALVNQINNVVIHASCANRYNCDPLLAYKCLKAKFPNANEYNIFEKLTCSFYLSDDILDYDWEQVRLNIKKLRIAGQMGDSFAYTKLFKYFTNMRLNVFEKTSLPFRLRLLRCTKCDSEFAVTLDGKFSCCLNGYSFLNTVDDDWKTILNAHSKYAESIASSYCDTCCHSDICWKQCALNVKNKDGIYFICEKFLIPFYDIIKQEIKMLANPIDIKDIEWFKEQEKVMEQQVQAFLLEGKRYEKEHTRLPINVFV